MHQLNQWVASDVRQAPGLSKSNRAKNMLLDSSQTISRMCHFFEAEAGL